MDQPSWPIFTPYELENTPSRVDGITAADEKKLRGKTVFLIETLCKYKNFSWANKSSLLPQASACMYFHRFYQYQSFRKHDRQVVAVACLFLACKVEEDPKRIKDMITGYFDIKKLLNPDVPQVTDEQKMEMLEKVLIAERVILQTLAFDLRIVHPIEKLFEKWKFVIKYLTAENKAVVKQSATRFLTDCYRTTIPIQYTQKDIAVSCLFLSTLELGEPPLASKVEGEMTWLDLFDSDISDEKLNEVCNLICDIYETEVNVVDPQKALKLRTRLAASKKHGPSPNCISSANSPSAPMQSSPDSSYLFEEEEEVKRKVTVSVIKRSDDGSMTSTGYTCRQTHSQPPPPPQSSPFQSFPSPSCPTPPPPAPPDSPWSERSASGTPAHAPPPPPASDTPDHIPPPPLPTPDSPSHRSTEDHDHKRVRMY